MLAFFFYGLAVNTASIALQKFFVLFFSPIFNFVFSAEFFSQIRLKNQIEHAILYFPIFLQVFEQKMFTHFFGKSLTFAIINQY